MSTANESGDEAACRDLCPDAETAVYLENKGSDDINDSISKTGRPYSELPTALRYRTAVDKTCVCHHDLAPRYSIAKDATLRKGDGVMTAKGLVVYDGGREFPHSSNDFVAVDNALLPAGERAELLTMQQHGLILAARCASPRLERNVPPGCLVKAGAQTSRGASAFATSLLPT